MTSEHVREAVKTFDRSTVQELGTVFRISENRKNYQSTFYKASLNNVKF